MKPGESGIPTNPDTHENPDDTHQGDSTKPDDKPKVDIHKANADSGYVGCFQENIFTDRDFPTTEKTLLYSVKEGMVELAKCNQFAA